MSHRCNFCNLHFTSLPAFYRHRVGEGNARRCMTDSELFGNGLRIGEHYSATSTSAIDITPDTHPGKFVNYISKPRELKRAAYEAKEPIEKSHVRWLFNRGITPDRINKAGIPIKTVVEVVDEEIKKLREAP
jgi:hypothetical protein